MAQELLHKMQEKFPIYILVATGLLDLSGASRNGHHVSGVLGLNFPEEAQPRAESSPVPSEALPITEENSNEGTFNFQSPAVDPTNETTADFIPVHTETATERTAVLPEELVRNLEVPQQHHTEAAAFKLQGGHTFPSKLLSSTSIPVSTQRSQTTMHLEQTDRSLQGKPGNITEAGFSPASSSTGLPQPSLTAGTHQDSRGFTALSSIRLIKQMEVPSPKTSLLTSTVNLHPARKEIAASPFPTGVVMALESSGVGWLLTGTPPTSKRPKDRNLQVHPDSKAGVTPAYLLKTRTTDAKVTPPALVQKPASGDLDAVYSRMPQTSAVQFSPVLSLGQETTGSKIRNAAVVAINESGHPTQLPALQSFPQGNVHSSLSLLNLEALVHDKLLPSRGPISTTDRQQALSLSRTLNCTKHVSQETNRSAQEIAVLVLQRDTDQGTMTSNPEKPRSPEALQASTHSSSLSQPWISTLKLSQTTKELKGVTSALSAGTSAFGNAALQPVSTVDSGHEGLQPPGTSSPTSVGLQLTGIPTSAETRPHITSPTSAGSRSLVQGTSALPVSREALPMMLQMSTVEDSKRKKSLLQQIGKTDSASLTPQASPVPSLSGLHDNRNQTVSLQSFAPSTSQIQQPGSLAAFASKLPLLHAQGSQSSSATAHPELVVPSVSEIRAYLAQALVQQFGLSQDAATKNLSAFRGDHLTVLPSSPYLSFLLRSADGMICLQPMQDAPLPPKLPNTGVGSLVSIQQILAVSNSSVLDLANLENVNHSSLILVKPVFILLPTARPDLQMVPSPESGADHETALLFMSNQDHNVGTPESIHNTPKRTGSSSPTSKSLRPEAIPSTASNQRAEKTKVTQPVLTNPNSTAITSLFQAASSVSNHLLDPRRGISSTVQATSLHRLPEEMQVPTPHSQEAEGTPLLSLSGVLVEPFTTPAPPLVSAQHSPPISPKVVFTTEKPYPSSVIPFLSAKGLPDFQMPAQAPFAITGTADQVQRSKKLTLEAPGHGQGSVSTPSSVPAQCVACLTLPSARTIKHPLKVFTSIRPLQSTSQSLPSTASLQRLPSQTPFVPSTSPASSVQPAGNGHQTSVAGSVASSGVPAQTRLVSLKPNLPQHLQFTAVVTKPLMVTGRPTAAPAPTAFSTKVQIKTTAPGKLLTTLIHPSMYASSPGSPPSPASTYVPLLSAIKRDQIHPAPAKLLSQASMEENTKPTEINTTARKIGTGKFLGTSVSLFNTRTQQIPTAVLRSKVLTLVHPSVSAASVALQRQPKLIHPTSQSALAMTSSVSAAKNDDISTALTNNKQFHLPTSTILPDPNMLLPTVAEVIKSPAASTPRGKSEDRVVKGAGATASQLPTRAPTSVSHQASARYSLEKVSLEREVEHETGHSSPGTALYDTGLSTTKTFSVLANRLVPEVTNQSAVLNKVAVNDADVLLAGDLIQFLPTPEGPSYSSVSLAELTPQGSSLLGVASTGQAESLLWNTEAEEVVQTNEVTEEAAEGVVTVLTLMDLEPSALLSDSHQRRGLQSDATILNGFAVVSDDVCGSGNYTVQMSLRPVADAGPEIKESTPSQETFLALITMQSNSSQPVLQIRSCCVTPSASPGAPGAVCCLFHRLPFECRHIQLLQSSKSRTASFTIQLFQMLNHSVAYLHCELNICLRGNTGCEQDCFESGEPLLQPSDRNSYRNPHNLISFGPVLRMNNRLLYKPMEGPDSAMLIPILLGSLTGFAVLGSAFISLWLHHRQKTKNMHCPQIEIHGL